MTNRLPIARIISLVALAVSSLVLAAAEASAQATRTWVSGTGNDADPCSRTAPCKTFAGAISKTAAGGEINALDPGGFGAVTITKSITIDGGGQVASVLAAGTNGIIINGAGITVTVRNLRINGVGLTPTPGLNGVQFLSGQGLHVENCDIFGFTQNAININVNTASPVNVFVTDTRVSTSFVGINAHNASTGKVSLSIQRTTITQSGTGVKIDGTGGAAAIAAALSDAMIAGNNVGVSSVSGPGNAGMVVTRSSIVNNTTSGASATGAGGILFSNTVIFGNGTGLAASAGGSLGTYQNNSVDANTTNGAFTSTLMLK